MAEAFQTQVISIIAICLLASVANAIMVVRSINPAANLAFAVCFLLGVIKWSMELLLPQEIASLDAGLLLLNTFESTSLIALWCAFWLRCGQAVNWRFMGGLLAFWMLPLAGAVLLDMPRGAYLPFALCSICAGVISSIVQMYRKRRSRNVGDWGLIFCLLFGFLVNLSLVPTSFTTILPGSITIGDLYLGFLPAITAGLSLFSLLSFTLDAIHDSETLARTDGLTGLLNRRAFDNELAIEVARTQRYPRDLSLITLDIDKFKHLNDTYGHPTGDEVIRAVSRVLLANSRRVDRVARIGGEEFALILADTPSSSALRLAERLRQAMSNDNSTGIAYTASFGVACLQSADKDPEALLHAADRALYAAKAAGRNCVRYAREPNRDPAAITDPAPAHES